MKKAPTTHYHAAIAMQKAGEIGAVKTYPFARIEDAMTDLAAGRIAAVMKVAPVASWLARRTPGLRILGPVPSDPQPLGIGFNKANICLLADVNHALTRMKSEGSYHLLAQRWGVP